MEKKNESLPKKETIKNIEPAKKVDPLKKDEATKKNEPVDKKKSGKKGVLLAIMLLAVIGVCVAGVSLYRSAREARENRELQEAMQAAAAEAELSSAPLVQGWMAEYARQPDKIIDFVALAQTNEDIYAWITVPGTPIDYPVLFAAKGDERYLTHDAEGKESKYGAIYTDGYNSRDFSDPMTVVYGHNMEDGSMFAALHEFENGDFFDANRTIRVYIGEVMLEYEIFAAYKTDNTHILHEHDFADAKAFTDYMDGVFAIRDMNAKLKELVYDANSRVITLATCIHGEDTARYLVQGALKVNE